MSSTNPSFSTSQKVTPQLSSASVLEERSASLTMLSLIGVATRSSRSNSPRRTVAPVPIGRRVLRHRQLPRVGLSPFDHKLAMRPSTLPANGKQQKGSSSSTISGRVLKGHSHKVSEPLVCARRATGGKPKCSYSMLSPRLLSISLVCLPS